VNNKDVDFSALDVRVGKVLSCQKHPDADNLYVEQIDVGEMKCRTVCSGLTAYMTADEVKGNQYLINSE
jgi:tRNA-binding EMAP/Myf-like protein